MSLEKVLGKLEHLEFKEFTKSKKTMVTRTYIFLHLIVTIL